MQNKSRAFTLIELLVVVLIIGILAAIALPQYQVAVRKSRFAQTLVMGRSLNQAQQVYFLANGSYATSFDKLDLTPIGTLSEDKKRIDFDGGYCKFNTGDLNEFVCSTNPYSATLVIGYGYSRQQFECYASEQNSRKVCINSGGVYKRGTIDAEGYESYLLFNAN